MIQETMERIDKDIDDLSRFIRTGYADNGYVQWSIDRIPRESYFYGMDLAKLCYIKQLLLSEEGIDPSSIHEIMNPNITPEASWIAGQFLASEAFDRWPALRDGNR